MALAQAPLIPSYHLPDVPQHVFLQTPLREEARAVHSLHTTTTTMALNHYLVVSCSIQTNAPLKSDCSSFDLPIHLPVKALREKEKQHNNIVDWYEEETST